MGLLRICGILLLVLTVLLILKEMRPKYALLVSGAAVIFLIASVLPGLKEAFSLFTRMGTESGFGVYVGTLLKALGIGLCTGFLAEFCRDAGENTLSRAAELCGKGAILTLALPLVREFLEVLQTSLREG